MSLVEPMQGADAVVVVESLSVTFPDEGSHGEVVRGVSFSVKEGQRVGR